MDTKIKAIIECLDNHLSKTKEMYISPKEGNHILEKANLLNDSKDKPGKPLRKILKNGNIPHAFQLGRHWYIPHSAKTKQQTLSLMNNKTSTKMSKTKKTNKNKTKVYINFQIFQSIESLKSSNIDVCGFYCIRLKEGSTLPNRYQKHLRSNRIIYIGKAEGQSLRKRLYKQELNAIGHGTFFRSMGAALGYRPEKGSTTMKSNKNNYTFSEKDKNLIINWMITNLEVCWVKYEGDFSIEKQLIKFHIPLFNYDHNPIKLTELIEDREICRQIARNI